MPQSRGGGDEERSLIHDWLTLNAAAGTWGGYPVGGSYIDSRCGSGHGMLEIKEYVDFDREFAQKVPWLNGKRKSDVQARYDELVELTRPIMEGTAAWREVDHLSEDSASEDIPNFKKNITHAIMTDRRLSVSDIRDIAKVLMCQVG